LKDQIQYPFLFSKRKYNHVNTKHERYLIERNVGKNQILNKYWFFGKIFLPCVILNIANIFLKNAS